MSTLAPPHRATVPADASLASRPPLRRRRTAHLTWLRRWPSPIVLLAIW